MTAQEQVFQGKVYGKIRLPPIDPHEMGFNVKCVFFNAIVTQEECDRCRARGGYRCPSEEPWYWQKGGFQE